MLASTWDFRTYLKPSLNAHDEVCSWARCIKFCLSHPHPSIFGPRSDKTCPQGFANNISPDQPVHPHRLISAFVIRLLESIISKLTSSEISIF